MSGPLLFIAADPRECAGLISHWQEVRPAPLPVHWVRAGKWKGRDVMAIANGAGSDRAFAAVLVAPRPSAVCSIGLCGALDPGLRVGDVFVACEVRNGAQRYETLVPEGVGFEVASGAVASIDHIALSAAEKSDLRATGASIVEMEAAGAVRAAEDLGLPFYCIRVVSDLAHEDFINNFNAVLGPDGRYNVWQLIRGALASPRARFGELLRLKRRSEEASTKLGDFLANCRF